MFLSGVVPGLFLRDRRIMGLSVPLRSPCFPLWLSVEDRALGIVGLELGLGLEMGEFVLPTNRDDWRGFSASDGFS